MLFVSVSLTGRGSALLSTSSYHAVVRETRGIVSALCHNSLSSDLTHLRWRTAPGFDELALARGKMLVCAGPNARHVLFGNDVGELRHDLVEMQMFE